MHGGRAVGSCAEGNRVGVQERPPSSERWWPSGPQLSTVDGVARCATTPKTALPDGLTKTWVQVAPLSWLTARPQSVPTKTSEERGTNEIPHAWLKLHGGSALAGFLQSFRPPSPLTQIPPWLITRVSRPAVAITMFESFGSIFTSTMRKGGRASM